MMRKSSPHRVVRVLLILLATLWVVPAQAKVIAVSMAAYDAFRNLLTDAIEKEVDRRGDDSYITSADISEATQIQQIKTFHDAGVDGLIVLLVSGRTEYVNKIVAAAGGLPIVFINNEPESFDQPANVVYVGSNELESGTLEMEELARLANYQGKVAVLIGEPNHHSAQARTKDVETVAAKYPNISVVNRTVANWSRQQAYTSVRKWLTQKMDFNIIAANNDEMAIGAILAMDELNVPASSYLIGGVDATQDALKAMADGKLDVTVFQNAKGQGKGAVDVIYRLINGEKVASPYWIPFELVSKNNYMQYMNN